MRSTHSQRRRGWGARAALCLFLSMFAASCAAVPEIRPAAGERAAAAPPPPPPPLLPAPAHFHFLRGYLAELTNDVPVALREYRAALDVDPASVFLRLRLAALGVLSGGLSQAVAVLDDIPRDRIRDGAMLNRVAKLYAGAGRPERALELYDDGIHANPDGAGLYFAKGALLLTLKRPAEAEGSLTLGLVRDPESHLGYFYRGRALEAQGRRDEAKEDYRRAIARAAQYVPASRALARVLEAEGDVAGAIGVFEALLGVGDEDGDGRMDSRMGMSGMTAGGAVVNEFARLLLRGKQYGRALGVFDWMIEKNPGDVNAQIRRAVVLVEMDEAGRAIEELKRLLLAHPSELRVRDYLGWAFEKVGDVGEALAAYRVNVGMDGTFYDSQIHLGALLYRLGRFDEAAPALTRAAGLNPGNADTHRLLGLSYVQAKRFDLARAAFVKGLEYHPADEDLRFNLGAVFDKLNRFADVEREMKAVLALNPDHADALNYLGYSYADRGIRGDEAVTLTQHAVSIKPDNGAYVDSLGWALFRVGRVAEALRELRRAVELVNDDPVIFEHLGEIYLTQGRREKAQGAWMRALDLDPENAALIRRFREVGFGTPGHLSGGDEAASDDRDHASRRQEPAAAGAAAGAAGAKADAGP